MLNEARQGQNPTGFPDPLAALQTATADVVVCTAFLMENHASDSTSSVKKLF
jgi:hypothetical protein